MTLRCGPSCRRGGGAWSKYPTAECSADSSAHVSARTILVLVTFSMVNLVLPPLPATRPIARERWSPRSILTVGEREERHLHIAPSHPCHCMDSPSVTSNESMNRSSSRSRARASCSQQWSRPQKRRGISERGRWAGHSACRLTATSNPSMKALTKSAPFCTEPGSSVSLDDWSRGRDGHDVQLDSLDQHLWSSPLPPVGLPSPLIPCGPPFSSHSLCVPSLIPLGPLPLPHTRPLPSPIHYAPATQRSDS